MCGLCAAVYPLSLCASVCLPNHFQSLSNVHIVVSMISGSIAKLCGVVLHVFW